MYKKSTLRKQQAERTKRLIYDIAMDLFARKGFDYVTVEEIAAKAGVSVGAFYHHFRNKQEIIAVTYQESDKKYETYYNKVSKSPQFASKTSIEQLEYFMLHTIGVMALFGPEFLSVVYRYMFKDQTFVNVVLDRERTFFSVLKRIIQNGKNCGEIIDDMSVEQIMLDLTAVIRGCAVEWCFSQGEKGIYSQSATVIKNYLRGISTLRD